MFVTNHPALVIRKTIIIADIHIGLEHELWKAGVSVPSQITPIVERLKTIKTLTKSKRLVINGDIKHGVPAISRLEERGIPVLMKKLSSEFDVTVVKGNHDGNIERLIADVDVMPYFKLGSFVATHGHRSLDAKEIKKAKTIAIGHNHLGVAFHDPSGLVMKEQCWVIGLGKGEYDGRKIIIMPAFNQLCGITPASEDAKLLGPIAKSVLLPQSDVYLLDGTHLGKLKDIETPDDETD